MTNIFKININQGRVFGLDILRALAIMFVVIGHGSNLLPSKFAKIIDAFVFDGVSIFFVLSGFLIGRILLKTIIEHGINRKILMDFWVRRWYRTLPNYFFILVLLCLLNLFFNDAFNINKVYRFFVFSQNLTENHPSWFFPEAWSLSIEEWFYIILPLLMSILFLILRISVEQIVLISCMLIILSITYFRYYRFLSMPINSEEIWDLTFRKQVFTRLDSLTFGVIGAYVQFYYFDFWLKFKRPFLFWGITLFVLYQFVTPIFTEKTGLYSCVFSLSLNAIATLLVLPYLSEIKTGNGYFYKYVTYVSLISYSMYLLNLSIIQYWIIHKIPWYDLIQNTYLILILKYSLYWILLFPLSILLYKYYEVPMTKLRDKRSFK